MAGEITGTKVLIANGTGEIFGQAETSRSNSSAPVDISNKSYEDHVTYLAGEGTGKQESWPMTIIFSDSAEFKKMRADSITQTPDTYTLTYADSGYSITGTFHVTAWAETFPHGSAVTASCTLMSSGEPTNTDPV